MFSHSNMSSYYHALTSPQLDSASFILLALAILEKKLNGKILKSDTTAILENFVHGNIEFSLKLIMKICQENNELLAETKLIPYLTQKKFSLNDNPLKNQSNRFFESLFASHLWHSFSDKEFKSFQKLANLLIEINPELQPISVNSLETISTVLQEARELYEKYPKLKAVEESLRNSSPISNQKDRGSEKEITFSCNPGILKSINPCYTSHVKPIPESGRIVDLFYINEKLQGFSFKNKHVPFVNSVSGTVFRHIITLSHYMEKHKDDLRLSIDINHFIHVYMAFGCMNGYHSFPEMLCVFKSPEITAIFSKYHVKLNLSFPEHILKSAYKESIEYTKKLSLQEIAHSELQAHPRFK